MVEVGGATDGTGREGRGRSKTPARAIGLHIVTRSRTKVTRAVSTAAAGRALRPQASALRGNRFAALAQEVAPPLPSSNDV